MRFLSLQRHYTWVISLLGAAALLLWGIALCRSIAPKEEEQQAGLLGDTAIKTVVIDPGHGGIDGGATTDSGLPEKDINLSISLTLRDLFAASGWKVIMTRTEDIDLSSAGGSAAARKTEDLKARLALFEQTEACIVLSIHQNHYEGASSHGAQMFYGGQNALSKELAENIQSRIVKELQPDNTRQIKQITKDVYIVYHTTRPIVLCECGFLSNPTEAALLSDEMYCKEMAFCIYAGVIDAFSPEDADPSDSAASEG